MFLGTFVKVLVSGLLMGVGVWAVLPIFGLFGAIGIGIVLYIAFILVTKVLTVEELKEAKKMFKR